MNNLTGFPGGCAQVLIKSKSKMHEKLDVRLICHSLYNQNLHDCVDTLNFLAGSSSDAQGVRLTKYIMCWVVTVLYCYYTVLYRMNLYRIEVEKSSCLQRRSFINSVSYSSVVM